MLQHFLGILPQLISIHIRTIKCAHTRTNIAHPLLKTSISILRGAPVCALRLIVPILRVD